MIVAYQDKKNWVPQKINNDNLTLLAEAIWIDLINRGFIIVKLR